MTELAIILLCLLINMLLSGSEMAFVTVNRQQLKRLAGKDKNAQRLLRLKDSPERTLSVIQIGITLVGAIAAAVGGAGAEEALSPYLMKVFSVREETSEALAIAFVVLPISYLSVVVGELVPKSLALRNPMAISLFVVKGLMFAEFLFSPAVTILEKSTNLVLKIFPSTRKPSEHSEAPHIEMDDLNYQTKQYVVNLVSADKKIARDVMLPWGEVVFVNKSSSIEEVEAMIISSRHTRLPVLEGEDVVGLINTKELLTASKHGATEWHELIRPVLRYKAFEPLFRILLKMQEQKSHMAVIYDQLKPSGLVTMEDIVEEIIGDVFDEDDDGLLKKIMATKARRRPV